MKKTLIVMFLLLTSITALAEETFLQGGMVISLVLPTSNGAYIGFETTPSTCSGSYHGRHGFLYSGNSNYKEQLAFFRVSQAIKKPISVNYISNGDCTSLDSLLSIEGGKL